MDGNVNSEAEVEEEVVIDEVLAGGQSNNSNEIKDDDAESLSESPTPGQIDHVTRGQLLLGTTSPTPGQIAGHAAGACPAPRENAWIGTGHVAEESSWATPLRMATPLGKFGSTQTDQPMEMADLIHPPPPRYLGSATHKHIPASSSPSASQHLISASSTPNTHQTTRSKATSPQTAHVGGHRKGLEHRPPSAPIRGQQLRVPTVEQRQRVIEELYADANSHLRRALTRARPISAPPAHARYAASPCYTTIIPGQRMPQGFYYMEHANCHDGLSHGSDFDCESEVSEQGAVEGNDEKCDEEEIGEEGVGGLLRPDHEVMLVMARAAEAKHRASAFLYCSYQWQELEKIHHWTDRFFARSLLHRYQDSLTPSSDSLDTPRTHLSAVGHGASSAFIGAYNYLRSDSAATRSKGADWAVDTKALSSPHKVYTSTPALSVRPAFGIGTKRFKPGKITRADFWTEAGVQTPKPLGDTSHHISSFGPQKFSTRPSSPSHSFSKVPRADPVELHQALASHLSQDVELTTVVRRKCPPQNRPARLRASAASYTHVHDTPVRRGWPAGMTRPSSSLGFRELRPYAWYS